MASPSSVLARSSSLPLVVRFAPRGRMLAAGHADGTLLMWSVEVAPRPLGQGAHRHPVLDVLYSPRLSLAVTRTPEHLHGWAVPDVRETFAWHVGPVDDALFLPDGNHVMAAGPGRLTVIDLRDGRTARETSIHGSVARMAFDPRRNCLVTLLSTGGEKRLETRALDTFEPLSTVPVAPSTRAFTLAPDGLGCALTGPRVEVVERADGHVRQVLETAHEGETEACWSRAVFSAEGRLLVAGSPCGRVHVWDTLHHRSAFVLEGHEGAVLDVDMLHGRGTVASGGADGTVRLWTLTRRS